jgi:hypothetical protein
VLQHNEHAARQTASHRPRSFRVRAVAHGNSSPRRFVDFCALKRAVLRCTVGLRRSTVHSIAACACVATRCVALSARRFLSFLSTKTSSQSGSPPRTVPLAHSPTCTVPFAQSHLHSPICTVSFAQSHLHSPTCTVPLAQSHLHSPTWQVRVRDASALGGRRVHRVGPRLRDRPQNKDQKSGACEPRYLGPHLKVQIPGAHHLLLQRMLWRALERRSHVAAPSPSTHVLLACRQMAVCLRFDGHWHGAGPHWHGAGPALAWRWAGMALGRTGMALGRRQSSASQTRSASFVSASPKVRVCACVRACVRACKRTCVRWFVCVLEHACLFVLSRMLACLFVHSRLLVCLLVHSRMLRALRRLPAAWPLLAPRRRCEYPFGSPGYYPVVPRGTPHCSFSRVPTVRVASHPASVQCERVCAPVCV